MLCFYFLFIYLFLILTLGPFLCKHYLQGIDNTKATTCNTPQLQFKILPKHHQIASLGIHLYFVTRRLEQQSWMQLCS